MRYILLANNTQLIHFKYADLLNSLLNVKEDIVITFNHCLPKLTIFPALHEDTKIYHFCRCSFNREIPYSGLHAISDVKHRFNKLFLWPHPEVIGNSQNKEKANKYLKEKTDIDIKQISHMIGNAGSEQSKTAREFLRTRYNNNTNMSLGMIVYLYIQHIKQPEDQLILIGFDHTMNKDKHNQLGEIDFFYKEKEEKKCVMIPLKS